MSKQVQWRRGTAPQNNAFTGAAGEVTVDTTGKSLRVHDGAAAGGFETARKTALDAHVAATNNPHSVTASQVGLGNVDNTSDANKPISAATQTALDLKASQSGLDAHVAATDNPHAVTAAQVGLGSVDNTSDVSKPISTATATALAGKSDVDHGHTVGEIENLTGALNDRARVEDLAAAQLKVAEQATYFVTQTYAQAYLKNGVIPLLGTEDELLVWMDMQGVLHAPSFASGTRTLSGLADGKASLIDDQDGGAMVWFDAKERAIRHIGDHLDNGGSVPGAFAVTDPGGARVAMGLDGEIMAPSATAAATLYVAPVDDGGGSVNQVFVADGTTSRRLTASVVDCYAPEIIAPGLARYARSDGRVGLVRVPRGVPAIGGDPIEMIPKHGQSLAIGSTSYDPTDPVIRHPISEHSLMFNGGIKTAIGLTGPGGDPVEYDPADFTSLVSALEVRVTSSSETGMAALGFGLSNEVGRDILVTSTGIGGVPYTSLKKGTVPYANLMYGVTRGDALAAAASRPFQVPVLIWRHGESNEDSTGAQYRASLIELQNDFASDTIAITGQASDPVLFVQQINRMEASAYSGGAAYQLEGPGQALADLVQNPAADIAIVAPQYVFEFGDDFHMLVESYVHAAAYDQKAIRRHVYQGMPWRPLHAASAVRTGKFIDVTIAGGWVDHGGAVTIDDSYVTDPGMYGVVYADDTMSATVARVEVTGRNRMTVTLSNVPTGSDRSLGFAYYAATDVDDQGRTTGLRCCIRDNDPDACPVTGLPLHNYMISHQIGV